MYVDELLYVYDQKNLEHNIHKNLEKKKNYFSRFYCSKFSRLKWLNRQMMIIWPFNNVCIVHITWVKQYEKECKIKISSKTYIWKNNSFSFSNFCSVTKGKGI